MSKYHDDQTCASDPGQISFCADRYRRIEPRARGLRGWLNRQFLEGRAWEERLEEHLRLGDSRAACVVSLEPLLVAAYTDELDCIAMLRFPSWIVAESALKMESRLLTVNTYDRGGHVASDLVPGPANLFRYTNFFPIIADFLSNDRQRIERRKSDISEEEWRRCRDMGSDYLRRYPRRWRNGSPAYSWMPATQSGFDVSEDVIA